MRLNSAGFAVSISTSPIFNSDDSPSYNFEVDKGFYVAAGVCVFFTGASSLPGH